MNIKKGSKLFVRIDYKIEDKGMTREDFSNHLSYVKNVAQERYFIGGGFSNIDGGMCLFAANNFEEAQQIVKNDPIIEKGIYRYELFEWDVAVLSETIGDK